MNNPITDQELDSFFDWLKPKLPKPKRVACPPPPAISQELLDMARLTAKTHLEHLFDQGLYCETLHLPWAASEDENVPFNLDSIGGEWSVTREFIRGDDEYQILKWRCKKEYRDLFEQRRIHAQVGNQPFDLGQVVKGIAKVKIPRNIDLLTETVSISIHKIVDEE